MANDIFQNIGNALYRGGRAGQGYDVKAEELQRKLQILQQMPQGSPAQAKYARSIMEAHGPEIMKNMPQGAYQSPQESTTGKPPWWTDPAARKEFPNETAIAGGTQPRAVDPWTQLGKMSDTEANLGVNQETGESRFPALTGEINRRINEFQLPGTKPKEIGLRPDLFPHHKAVVPSSPVTQPATPTVQPSGAFDEIGKELQGGGADSFLRGGNLFNKTGEGVAPGATKGPNKEYGKPVNVFGDSQPPLRKAGVESIGSELKKAYMPSGKFKLLDRPRTQRSSSAPPPKPALFNPRTKPPEGRLMQMPSEPKDTVQRAAWQRVWDAWGNIPSSLQWEIWNGTKVHGLTWEQIASSDDLKKYLE